jgi:hypothetical protein
LTCSVWPSPGDQVATGAFWLWGARGRESPLYLPQRGGGSGLRCVVYGGAELFACIDEVGVGVGPHPAGLEGVLDGATLDLGGVEELLEAGDDLFALLELGFGPFGLAAELCLQAFDGEVPAVAVKGVSDAGGDGIDGGGGELVVGKGVGDEGVELFLGGPFVRSADATGCFASRLRMYPFVRSASAVPTQTPRCAGCFANRFRIHYASEGVF